MLHEPTLLWVHISITVLTTLLLMAAAAYADAPREQRLWATGNMIACLGLVLGTLTGLPLVVHGALSYGLMGLGLALVWRGLRLFCGLGLSGHKVMLVALLSLLLPGYFALVQPSLNGRLIVSGLFMGALNLVCAATLWQGVRDASRRVIWVSVAGFGMLGLVLMGRGVYLLLQPLSPQDTVSASVVTGDTLFVIPLAQVTIAYGLLMLVARRYAQQLKRLTLLDGLTGALNRPALDRMGARILARARQARSSVTLAMIDADHFKRINDTHGHLVGDQVLCHLVELLTLQLRPGDLVVRYGGEEFVLIMDGLDLAAGLQVAERLRGLVENAALNIGKQTLHYAVSIGISCTDNRGYELGELIAAADAALYEAKRQGRNRVCAS